MHATLKRPLPCQSSPIYELNLTAPQLDQTLFCPLAKDPADHLAHASNISGKLLMCFGDDTGGVSLDNKSSCKTLLKRRESNLFHQCEHAGEKLGVVIQYEAAEFFAFSHKLPKCTDWKGRQFSALLGNALGEKFTAGEQTLCG